MKKRHFSASWLVFFLLFVIIGLFSPSCHAATQVKAAMLVNLSTGKILYERSADMQIPPASLTKIMTMFLAMDAITSGKLSLNQKIAIDREAAGIGGSVMRINAGEKIPVVRLMAGMAVASGNDAAMAIAKKTGGSIANFVKRMNQKARSLGMKGTTFKNPTGLPAAGQKTTARDLMLLCRAYLKNHPSAARFHNMTFFMHKGSVMRNTNPLLGQVKGVDGLKTGWTVASGYNLIITAKRGKTRLLAIVLGGQNKEARDSMAKRLVEAGFSHPANAALARKMIDR